MHAPGAVGRVGIVLAGRAAVEGEGQPLVTVHAFAHLVPHGQLVLGAGAALVRERLQGADGAVGNTLRILGLGRGGRGRQKAGQKAADGQRRRGFRRPDKGFADWRRGPVFRRMREDARASANVRLSAKDVMR